MKHHLFIGLFVLLVLTGCHNPQREARHMVSRAEQLFDSMPDSSARLIDSILRMPVYFKEKLRMDMALLQGDALFGDHGQEIPPLMDDKFFDDRPFLTTSPELEHTATYYARKKQYGKAAHAALYSGFVQQQYNDKAAAMQSFKDAERYGELARDSLSVALAQYKIGRMLYNDGMEQEALSMLKNAEQGFGDRQTENGLAKNLIAVCYMLLGEFDNAEIYLQNSLSFAEKAESKKLKRKTLNNYAVLYQMQGKYDQAIECLKQNASYPDLDIKELLLLNLNLGDVYFGMKEMDSATAYYNCVEKLLFAANIKPETQLAAYDALFKFAESKNNSSLALQYRGKHEELLYKIMQQRQYQSIYRIQQQYDYESLQNTMNKKIIHRHRIIGVISILLIVSSVIILFLQYRHKQMMEAEKEMKQQIDAMKQDLRQTVKSSVLDQEIHARLKMILTANRTAKRATNPKNEWMSLVLQVMNGKENLFEAARATVEMAYPNLYAILLERNPNLTETEAKVCLLSFCDLSNAEMAELLGLKLNTVNQSRSTLRKKLNLKPDKIKEQLRNTLSN